MNKFQLIFFAVSVVLLLVGCASKTIVPVITESPVNKSVVQVQPEIVPAQVVVVESIPESLKELLANRWSVKSIKYDLKSTELSFQRTFRIRSDKMVVTPAGTETLEYNSSFFTTIFIDIPQKTANAYCDISRSCRGVEKGPFIVPFELYYAKTPYDWAQELESGKYAGLVEEPGEVLLEGRPTVSYKYSSAGTITEFYIEKFYGIPLKIESLDSSGNKKNWVYDSPAFNTVTPEQITPQV
ncbi:MAG: hypothetical protein Q7K43_06385 [Candidatus Woesearchaeota archaeon]|nr:hypothetical protein [Candidatus Woesearchaeota archaeon]